MSEKRQPISEQKPLHRRRFVQVAGGASLVGLAGCVGDESAGEEPEAEDPEDDGGPASDGDDGNEADDEGDEGEGEGEVGDGNADGEFVATSWTVPADSHVNRYNTANYSGQMASMIFDPLARYDTGSNEFIPYLAEWDIGDGSVTIELEEGREWHNGDEVVAEDLATQLRLDEHIGDPLWDYLAGIEVVDDLTLELEIEGEVDPEIIEHTLLGGDTYLDVKHDVFGEYLEAIEDADSGDDEDGAIAELLEFTWDDPVGNGPFEWDEMREQKGITSRWDGHPQADSINFGQFSFVHTPDNESHWEAFTGGEADGTVSTLFMPGEIRQGLPEDVHEFMYPNNGGMGMTFQNDHEIWGQPEARQAIAYLVERPPVAERSGGDSKIPVEVPHGVLQSMAEEYFPEVLDDLETYEGRQEDRAAELLEEAGLVRNDGTWEHEDGSEFRTVVNVQSGASDWVNAVQAIMDHLGEFGLQMDLETIEDPTYWGDTLPSSNFEIAMNFWGAGIPHPFFGLRWALASQDITEYNNFSTEIEVPGEIGDFDAELETWDVGEKVEQLSQSTGDEAEALMEELAWAVNYNLPVLPIQEKQDQNFISSDGWDIPDPDDEVYNVEYPALWLPRVGELQAE